MFLEIHTTIVDREKRYLDLNQMCGQFPGWKSFGQWIDKGNYIECCAGWMQCFSGFYHNLFVKYHLCYKNKENESIKKFVQAEQNITDPFSAMMYGFLSVANNAHKDRLA
jgi:hypothetical protein